MQIKPNAATKEIRFQSSSVTVILLKSDILSKPPAKYQNIPKPQFYLSFFFLNIWQGEIQCWHFLKHPDCHISQVI